VDSGFLPPTSRSVELRDRGVELIGSGAVPQTTVPLSAARQRYSEDVDRPIHEPSRGIVKQVAIGGYADPAAGGLRIPYHGLEVGMQQRLPPALKVEVLDHRQIRANTIPMSFGKISLEPAFPNG
jgi:hypothetical protein